MICCELLTYLSLGLTNVNLFDTILLIYHQAETC